MPGIKRLLTVDTIVASKLLEQIQFAVIFFIVTLYVGTWIDNLFPHSKPLETLTTLELFRDILLQLIVIIIASHYIKKVIYMVPFMFSLSKDYVPSKYDESNIGGSLGMGIIFLGIQKNFQDRISQLKKRWQPARQQTRS